VRKRLLNIGTVKQAITFDQPYLSAVELDDYFQISGKFIVAPSYDEAANGAIDHFEICIIVRRNFPRSEPIVFETGKRIPKTVDRHCYADGACCTGVWDEWRAKHNRPTLETFLEGPVRNYFLSQIYFEIHGSWPFGERSHGIAGIWEACADLLEVKNDPKLILRYLRVLAAPWPKGHWLCPCGSLRLIRECHLNELWVLHTKIKPFVAYSLFKQLAAEDRLRGKPKKDKTTRG
jgi:hypothetical protein